MTSDAQGVFVFIVTLPVIVLLSTLGISVSKKIDNNPNNYLKLSKSTIAGISLFIILSFIPFLNAVPIAVMEGIVSSFEFVTGKTPRQYFSDRNNLSKLIKDELQKTSGLRVDFSKIETAYNWNRLCLFTPYTSDLVAENLTGSAFKLSTYSDIGSSDSIHFIGLFDEKSFVNYVNLKRSEMDFSLSESVCIPRGDASFKRHLKKFMLEEKSVVKP